MFIELLVSTIRLLAAESVAERVNWVAVLHILVPYNSIIYSNTNTSVNCKLDPGP